MKCFLLFLAVITLSSSNDGGASAVEIESNSVIGRALLAQSTRLLNNNQNNENSNYAFLKSYSIKFQGCHHVQQWNEGGDEQDDVRIKTKRLARFRLCPADSCSSDKSVGCTAHYGDYVVDLNTFVTSYLSVLEQEQDTMCANVQEDCNTNCNGDANCMQACYSNYGLSMCWDANNNNGENNNNNNGFNVFEYGSCSQFNMQAANNNNNGEAVEYYLGPYCADQGGEIHLGLFTDDTCTTFAQYGSQLFYQSTGSELPYSDTSMVSTRCLTCAASSNGNNNNNNQYGYSQQCGYIYSLSGKCETRMEVDYPNESSCSYIEGIKIVRADGVIRTSTTRKSKAAAVAIGVFMTVAVLLGAYVYYLRTKLARAQINLAAASQPLT
jgi:hypothetical protein